MPGVLEAVAEKINSASAIFIAARGTSDHAAIYAKYVFETLTCKPVGLAAPSVGHGITANRWTTLAA